MDRAPLSHLTIGQLPRHEYGRRLRCGDLVLGAGPFALRLRSDIAAVEAGVRLLYADHPVEDPPVCCDYVVDVSRDRGLRRWIRPLARFRFDHVPTFEPLPITHALPLLEWSLNWCISSRSHQFLVLHAAVIERDGRAAVLPAPPGSGKSTLCAALIHRGWRLMSDELALIDLENGHVHALARPVGLKNRSIDLIAEFAKGCTLSALTRDTAKGTVALLKPPVEHVRRMHEPARIAWIVFPRYEHQAVPQLSERSKSDTMLELGRNAFNYAYNLRQGFRVLGDIVDRSRCLNFTYSRLDDGVTTFDRLAADIV